MICQHNEKIDKEKYNINHQQSIIWKDKKKRKFWGYPPALKCELIKFKL